MKEINIAKIIINKRREMGITQDELAEYIGVSKASISKWETGKSYPDITLLPLLASYFNISIDDLMDYSPQMNKAEIKKLYHNLSADFASKKFEDVLEQCELIIKKYYSCFPLILRMAILYTNHFMLAETPEHQKEILDKSISMCNRVQNESDDIWLLKEASKMAATCYLMQGDAKNVLEICGEEVRPLATDIEMQGSAFVIMGEVEKGKETFQIAMYQHLISFISNSIQYLSLNANNADTFEETLRRILEISKIFNVDKLHPHTMIQFYLVAAQIYCEKNLKEKALEMLNQLANVYTKYLIPLSLHGDEYFDKIGNWFETFDLGFEAPRSEEIIKESMVLAITKNPAFECLAENYDYKKIVNIIKTF